MMSTRPLLLGVIAEKDGCICLQTAANVWYPLDGNGGLAERFRESFNEPQRSDIGKRLYISRGVLQMEKHSADGRAPSEGVGSMSYAAKSLEDIAKAFEHCAWQATAFSDRLHKTKRAKMLAERESWTWNRAAQMIRETKLEGLE